MERFCDGCDNYVEFDAGQKADEETPYEYICPECGNIYTRDEWFKLEGDSDDK